MIRIKQLRLPCGHPEGALEEKAAAILRGRRKASRGGASFLQNRRRGFSLSVVRHSVDARKKPLLFDIYTVDVKTGLSAAEEEKLVRTLRDQNISVAPEEGYVFPESGTEPLARRPVVIGAGPAGLFCALYLAEHGYRPVLIERGRRMEKRTADVARFWETGVLDPGSNVQFGEGGAGTFSDGKLNTQVNDRTGRSAEVLQVFVEAGAPESILYEAMPHIGTDRLRTVIPGIRRRIEKAGGEVLFETVCTGFSLEDVLPQRDSEGIESVTASVPPRKLTGVFLKYIGTDGMQADPALSELQSWGNTVSESGEAEKVAENKESFLNHPERAGKSFGEEFFLPADAVVLAVGHSARDTIGELFRTGIPVEQKQFAVGLRVAHPQELIDRSQYGSSDPALLKKLRLPAAPYKLTSRASSGRGVYSFCMCPGGYIVNASSEEGHLCVNGMSDLARDSGWANSAVVVTVGKEEFGGADALAGLRFQRDLEKKAFLMGKGRIPVQSYQELRRQFLDGQRDPEKTDQASTLEAAALDGQRDPEKTDQASTLETAALDGQRDPEKTDQASTLEAAAPAAWCRGAFAPAPLHELLPQDLTRDFIEGMEQFGRKIEGFDGPQAIVAGIESRTSSPVRIPRGESFESLGAAGLYPCGEGAGYAGGIMSAAMDGMRVAEAIARRFAPLQSVSPSAEDDNERKIKSHGLRNQGSSKSD